MWTGVIPVFGFQNKDQQAQRKLPKRSKRDRPMNTKIIFGTVMWTQFLQRRNKNNKKHEFCCACRRGCYGRAGMLQLQVTSCL